MHRPNRFHLSTLVFLPFFGWSGFWPLLAHRRCRLSFTIALTAPCPFVVLALPPFSSLPSLPPTALVPARVRTHVRTQSTLLQLPIVTHHRPTRRSNNTTVFLPLPLPASRYT